MPGDGTFTRDRIPVASMVGTEGDTPTGLTIRVTGLLTGVPAPTGLTLPKRLPQEAHNRTLSGFAAPHLGHVVIFLSSPNEDQSHPPFIGTLSKVFPPSLFRVKQCI